MAGKARDIRAGGAYVEVGIQDKMTKAMLRIEARMLSWSRTAQRVGLAMTAIGTATLGGLFAATKAYADTGDFLLDLSTKTGVAVEALSELDYVAKLNDSSVEDLAVGMKFMQKNLVEAGRGSDGARAKFAALGMEAAALAGMTADQQLEIVADRLMSLEDPAERATAAMEIFGRSGVDLLPVLALGSKGIQELRVKAREMGLTISTQAAKDASDLNDALDTMNAAAKATAITLGASLAPVVRDVAKWLTSAAANASAFIRENQSLVRILAAAAATVLALGVALLTLSVVLRSVAIVVAIVRAAMAAWTMVLWGLYLASMLAIGPLGILLAVLTAIAATIGLIKLGDLAVSKIGGIGASDGRDEAQKAIDQARAAMSGGRSGAAALGVAAGQLQVRGVFGGQNLGALSTPAANRTAVAAEAILAHLRRLFPGIPITSV